MTRYALMSWGPVALYMAGIAALSHQPATALAMDLPDWPAHVAEYAGLAALVARGLSRSGLRLSLPVGAAALAGCTLFGATDELHQSFVPGRDPSGIDLAADAAGAAAALGVARLIRSRGARPGAVAHASPEEVPGGEVIEISLFSRPGCHLCEDAKKAVAEAAAGFSVRLAVIDVESDPDLARRYGSQVPVLTINGRKAFKCGVDAQRLREKLVALGSGRAS